MYPKTKREAVERLIEKVETALAKRRYAGVVGTNEDCPFCQWAVKEDHPGADVNTFLIGSRECIKCGKAFGAKLGYTGNSDATCGHISFDNTIELCEYGTASPKERRDFLTALLPVLKQMLKEMR
jgi:hypothetical protein